MQLHAGQCLLMMDFFGGVRRYSCKISKCDKLHHLKPHNRGIFLGAELQFPRIKKRWKFGYKKCSHHVGQDMIASWRKKVSICTLLHSLNM